MTNFEKVIDHLNEEYAEQNDKLKRLRDSGRSGDVIDELYSYCDQLSNAIDFLEDTPEELEKLVCKVEELNHFKDAVETIARVTKDMDVMGSEK